MCPDEVGGFSFPNAIHLLRATMEDEKKTKKQLIEELNELRQCVAELKGFEEEIKQTRVNHEKFTKAFLQNSIPVSITTLKEGQFVDVSDAFLRLMGRKRDEVIGHTSIEIGFITEDQRAFFFSELNKRGRIENLEMKVRTKGGALRYGLFNAVMMSIKNEKYLLTVMTDITDRKQAEEALMASEQQFRNLIEQIPIGIFTYEGTKFRYVNPACERITGYTPWELYRMEVLDISKPEFRDSMKYYMQQRQRGEQVPKHHEFKILTKTGEERWLERVAIELQGEKEPLVLVAVSDITDRKGTEEILKKSEEKYRVLLENASDAILLADTQGNIVEANKKAEELWGYTKEELLQLHYTQLHPMPELERTIAAFKEIIKRNTGHLSVGFIRRKAGAIVPVDITCNIIEYAGRKVVQGSFRDISEHKQSKDILEKLVRERTQELSRNNEQLKLEIKERKSAEAAMKRKSRELKHHADKLMELNAALKVFLKQREEDKKDLEEKVLSNVKHLINPNLETLKKRKLDPDSKTYLDILESNLKNIISPFSHTLSSKYQNLTPAEIKVANMIRNEKTTKEMAEFMRVSASAINHHRYHIRSKLGILTQKINLRSYLLSLS